MEYYQKASEALRQGEEYPLQLLKNAGLTALGGGAASFGSKALSKLVPAVGALINQYVPENLSISGLNKIDPRFGKFIQGAIKEGYSYEDLREFIGDKINKSQSSEPAKQNKNIIEQYSPELHQFILGEIQSGQTPMQAGARAVFDKSKNFEKIIRKMEKDHKTNWSDIIETIYGNQEKAQTSNQPQQSNQQEQKENGSGQQALMAILEKINQRLGQ